ncbi:bifunctional UDP-N-acetylmuramoyl-tripeptide:D-alanyl-D-alanine ligase/alanine racemase [Tunicatimonas pelagia]|uniref:bifunctional UDP-N-acetylmuramoyl-tripeptide:D-alanyl-D-alanine ligase/alanine racemase n=1 Tax=Tunicatimonas pelagia TaxID=931531 RepID=UPI0026666039|nr:bifunctional UDP-N-acetylmuramoyl-tripeptide:D-alanyl-D-alanine ligase/alanine racemase [Tunicatimonas pelagia]WKN42896.1 bifunctional UDP-N-acetylmuramoyl-tripeptide:D-alanyl-D-alanine ligase/alanine racemase [Tunicatimonas pelagia]
MTTFSQLETSTKGKVIQSPQPDRPIRYLLTDSRSGIQNEASLFFAIQGERHDGHRYVSELYERGVRQFVVEKSPKETLPEANVLLVPDSVGALQQIVAHHRQQFSISLVGITGSNGKTIVKEWLSQLLLTTERVVRNPKSYNSQIGVPLSVWGIDSSHTIGIFEAGISQAGEMEKLAKVLQPTIGIFTNVGPPHDKGFESRRQKVEEKSRLFDSANTIIYRTDYALVDEVLKEKYQDKKCCTWSTNASDRADYYVQWDKKQADTEIVVRNSTSQKSQTFLVPLRDEASLENITHALIFGIHHQYDLEKWRGTIRQLRPVSMRLEWKQGINHCYLVDDSYSNDFVSLQLALDFLKQQSPNKKFTVILSDILQSGESSPILYQKLADLLLQKGIERLIGIGSEMCQQQGKFQASVIETKFFLNTEEFLQDFSPDQFFQENILIKGARTFHFERIVRRLQQKIHSTVLEINLDAITHNLNQYRSKLEPSTKIMVMVKAFSYGGAAFEIANLLQFHQVDYLGVAYADEGVRLREHGIRTPILVLNPAPEAFETMLAYQLEPEIYSARLLNQYVAYLGEQAKHLPIHLMLDTGMHRLGFSSDEISQLINLLQQYNLKVGSVFSHLAAADEAQHDAFTQQQIQQFQLGYEQVADSLGYQPIRHILNSAGITRFPQYQFEMVRLGIGLYGVDSSGQQPQHLQTVGTLKTVISQIKPLKTGETVGYGRRGVADRNMTIATVAIGYADGLDRGFGNGNMKMLVNEQWAPTIGSVCMDMTMLDITGIDAQEGNEVIVFGTPQSVEALAQEIGTIPYEILTNIGERVKRVFYRES